MCFFTDDFPFSFGLALISQVAVPLFEKSRLLGLLWGKKGWMTRIHERFLIVLATQFTSQERCKHPGIFGE